MKTISMLFIALALVLPRASAGAATFTWTGASAHPENWYNVTNWSPYGVPGGGDTIIVPSGNAPFPGGAYTDVWLTGGNLEGQLTLAGTLSWTSGSVSGTLTVTEAGTIEVSEGATKAIHGSLQNAGRINLNADTTLAISPSGTLVNLPGGVVESQGNNGIGGYIWGWNYGTMNNQGLLRKTGGTNTGVAVRFYNSGTLQAVAGTLEVSNESMNPTGSGDGIFDAAQASSAILLRGYGLSSGARFTGAGTHRLIGGRLDGGTISNLELAGGNVVVNGSVTFSNTVLSSSMLVSSNGVVHGTLDWTGGEVGTGDPLVTAHDANLRLSGPATKAISGEVRNGGAIQFLGDAGLSISPSGTLVNLPGGVVESQGNNGIGGYIWGWNYGTMNNQGLFRKTGGTNTGVAVRFYNSGTLQAVAGTLEVSNESMNPTGSGDGIFDAAQASSAILLRSYALSSGARFTGEGTHRLIGGRLDGGTISNLELAGGNVVVNGSVTFSNTVLSGSMLVSSNGVVHGTLDWTGGGVETGDPLVTANDASLRLSGPATKVISGVVSNAGTIEFLGDAGLSISPSGTLVNLPSGVVESQGNNGIGGYIWGWNYGTMNNQGLFVKSGSNGTTTIAVGFSNVGLLEVQSGTLELPIQPAFAGGEISCRLSSASDYGRIAISGSGLLAGTLSASLAGGYAPPPGTRFPVVCANGLSGSFASLNLPDHFYLTYSATDASLLVGSGEPVQLVGPTLAGSNFSFGFQSEAGVDYTLESNDDLSTTNWSLVRTIRGDGARQVLLPAVDAPQRFFRISQ